MFKVCGFETQYNVFHEGFFLYDDLIFKQQKTVIY